MTLVAPLKAFLRADEVPSKVRISVFVFGIAGLVGSVALGGAISGLILLLLATIVLVAARRSAGPGDGAFVVSVVMVLLAVRVLAALVLDYALKARGTPGTLFLDDSGYLSVASQLADSWKTGVRVGLDPSVANNFVGVMAGWFYLFGQNTILIKLMNTGFGVLSAILVYRVMRNLKLPGARVGLLLMLVFPSLALWSALVLKDSFTLFFALAPIWLMSEYARSRRLVVTFALLVASVLVIENVRAYLFLILVVGWPLTLPFMVKRREWAKPTATAFGLAATLLVLTPALSAVNPNFVTGAEYIRRTLATGAGSSFVEPIPVARADPGSRFEITSPGCTAVPHVDRREITVQSGENLTLRGSAAAAQSDRGTLVNCGDIVVLAAPGPPPTIEPQGTRPPPKPTVMPSPQPIVLEPVGRNIIETPSPAPLSAGSSDALVVSRSTMDSLTYLPTGAAFLLTAPFPLTARSTGERIATPEMLLLYVAEAFAVIGIIWMLRRRRFEFAYGFVTMGAIGLALALFEGNSGTLVRHRGMLLPYIVMLAAVGAAVLLGRRSSWALTRLLSPKSPSED